MLSGVGGGIGLRTRRSGVRISQGAPFFNRCFLAVLPVCYVDFANSAPYIRWSAFPQNCLFPDGLHRAGAGTRPSRSDALLISALVLRSSWRDPRRCCRRRAHPL